MVGLIFTPKRAMGGLVILLLVGALVPRSVANFYGPPLHSALFAVVSPVSRSLVLAGHQVRGWTEGPLVSQDVTTLNELIHLREQELLQQYQLNRQLQERLNVFNIIQEAFPAYQFVVADVLGRSADGATEMIEIDAGARQGVSGQMVVVSVGVAQEGAHLIGRIYQVGPATSAFKPITASGQHITARLAPIEMPGQAILDRPLCQFDADGSERLVAIVPSDYPVAVGDIARLDDTSWPLVVQGKFLGRVEKIEPDDALRQRIIIRTMIGLRYLRSVTILVDQGRQD